MFVYTLPIKLPGTRSVDAMETVRPDHAANNASISMCLVTVQSREDFTAELESEGETVGGKRG